MDFNQRIMTKVKNSLVRLVSRGESLLLSHPAHFRLRSPPCWVLFLLTGLPVTQVLGGLLTLIMSNNWR